MNERAFLKIASGAPWILGMHLTVLPAHARNGQCALSVGPKNNANLQNLYRTLPNAESAELSRQVKVDIEFLRQRRRTSSYPRGRCGQKKRDERSSLVFLRKYIKNADLQCWCHDAAARQRPPGPFDPRKQ